ncbi:hypothetical protein L9F63_010996 [Diploptera punctata]|uniref:Regulatory protein zeste n=1 Tax=Diploptera punctata TaxID=6984 RepID=A0AAD8EPZ2_DIPPU|nr:hypothetical protein L9F63_010996 [Diploptera punctata]
MNKSENRKRKKMPNMSFKERNILVDLVKEHVDIIESKKTDAVTIQSKNKEWEKIYVRFNSHGLGTVRDVNNLRTTWDNLKKSAERKFNAERKNGAN